MEHGTQQVLVIDDEPIVRSALARSLRRAGYVVVQAGSAEQGLELVRDGHFLCALTDWRMPGLGGAGFLSGLRALGCDLPTIVLTGDDSFDLAPYGEWVLGLLPKPWPDATLRALIARAAPRAG